MAEVEVTQAGAVQTVTLNRPDRLNAFDGAMLDGLREAVEAAAAPSVRAVVVTGAGRGFCVGQDLAALQAGGADTVGTLLRERYHPVIEGIRALDKPVIAAVNGPAAGAGLALACACDLRIASAAAAFVPAFVSIGLVPDAGSSWFLTRLLGAPRALAWMTSGRRLGADEALAWGLVDEVVAADAFADAVEARAAAAASMPTRAYGRTKQLFETAAASALADQLEREAAAQAEVVRTADFAEGVAAFLEKRAPVFRGE